MSRRRKSTDTTPFDTLRLEGSLFVPELLERAASGEATFQKETDYAIPKGLKLHDEYGRAFRIATATWQSFAPQTARADLDAAAVTRSFAVDFLRQCLGYNDLAPLGAPIQLGDRGFPVTATALGGRLPVIIAPHHLGLDDPDPRFAIIGSGSRKKSAHQLAQEFLNASPDSLWAIVTNGKTLRLLRDADTLTRPNFLEFDLETILRDDQHRYADFSALWRILHASRAGEPTAAPTESIWEKWKSEGHAQGLRVRDGLRDGVTEAILILGRGFLTHPDNTALRQSLHDGTLTLDDYFQQFFRLIYRCLFLFCTEERDLLHPPLQDQKSKINNHQSSIDPLKARQAYATGYSLRRLRRRALRQSAHDPHGDLWLSLRIVFRSLAGGQEKLALPALGGLFAETQCPDLDSASLSNRDLLSAMRELRWFYDKKTGKRSAIDYRNMGTEELGSVYESLLELVPTIDLPARTFGFVGITDAGSTSGNARKTTGSYYTADPLVMELIKSALEPVIRQRLADARELAAAPWATVAARIATDSVQRTYVHAWLVKQSALPIDATPETFGRAWDSIPATARANPLCAEALLNLTVCDPSCGSGHFLLAAARRLAETLAELRSIDGAVRPDDYRHALREVASRCLYGVDINPMAVELCRVALWLETVDPGKPLGFLNHHIRHGNSLLGTTPDLIAAGLPDETFTAIEGDDKPACAELKKRNKAERTGFGPLFAKEEDSIREKLRQAATSIEAMDDSLPAALQKKEAAFLTNETAPETRHAKLLADLWCAAFVIKKTLRSNDTPVVSSSSQSPIPPPEDGQLLHTDDDLFGQPVPASKPTAKPKKPLLTDHRSLGTASGITTGTLRDFVQGKPLPEDLESEVTQLAEQYRFFHWHLAFPQVFDQGGFDCILGNPPWERVKIQEKEWFSSHGREDIANAATATTRQRLIKQLQIDQPNVYWAFQEDLRRADGESHLIRNSGKYPLCGRGDVNTYTIFTELNRCSICAGGRVGCIVPTGIATDDTTKFFFRDLVASHSLVSLFDIENRNQVFPGVHRSFRFSLLTLRRGGDGADAAVFAFFLGDTSDLHDPDRSFALSAAELALLNPNTHTCPIFAARADAEVAKAVYRRVPVLVREDSCGPEQSTWGVSFRTMFHMANDSNLFRTREQLESEGFTLKGNFFERDGAKFLPLYEAKMTNPYDHRHGSVVGNADLSKLSGVAAVGTTLDQHQDPDFQVLPRYWVNQSNVATTVERLKLGFSFLIVFRDVARATDVRTAILSVLPITAVGHKAPLILPMEASAVEACAFLAGLNSFAFDYLVRQKYGSASLSYFVIKQTPFPPLEWFQKSPVGLTIEWFQNRVLELTYTAWDLEAFAADCGWPGPPFRWDEDRRFLLRCELDAAFFHLYLGSEDEWRQQPEALTRAFPTPRHAVSYIMDTFPIVKRKDEAKHGTYRTKETILQIYDALAESVASGEPYQTLLNPPPADPACCHPPRNSESISEEFSKKIAESIKSLIVDSPLNKKPIPAPINPFFHPPQKALANLDDKTGRSVYYARVSQTETDVPGENGPRSFWRLEGFSQAWFDANPPPASEPTWSDPEQFSRYYSEAPIFLMELEVAPDQLSRFAPFGLINDFAESDSEPTEWFRLTAGARSGLPADEIVPMTVFPNINQEGIALTLTDIQLVDERTREQLDRAVSTGHIADASIDYLQSVLDPVRTGIDWAVVYDVGQGNCIGLCDPLGTVRTYFDIGGGMGPNLSTFPPALQRFCFTRQPPVILSHWDADHWCSAIHLRGREALRSEWIVPRQILTPAHVALLADIAKAGGRVRFLPANFSGRWFGQIHLELCTGSGRNHSGIALTLSEQPNGGGQKILMPGDADYQYIPSFTGGTQYLSVVAPHHGGKGKGSTPPTCPRSTASRLVYSYGPDNTYEHPHDDTRHDHDANGWNDPTLGKPAPCQVRETANRSASGLGHVLLGWKPHTTAPPVPCRGSGCQLEAQQL